MGSALPRRCVQLRVVLPAPHRRRVPLAGGCRGGSRRAVTVAGHHAHLGRRGPPSLRDAGGGRCRRGAGCGDGGRPPRCAPRHHRSAGRSRVEHRLLDGHGSHQAVPRSTTPGRSNGVATVAGWGRAAAAGARDRGSAPRAHGLERPRLPVAEHRLHRCRLPALVRRGAAPSDSGTAVARSGRSRHRGHARLARARPVALTGAADRVRRVHRGDRLRRDAVLSRPNEFRGVHQELKFARSGRRR